VDVLQQIDKHVATRCPHVLALRLTVMNVIPVRKLVHVPRGTKEKYAVNLRSVGSQKEVTQMHREKTREGGGQIANSRPLRRSREHDRRGSVCRAPPDRSNAAVRKVITKEKDLRARGKFQHKAIQIVPIRPNRLQMA
jgi:hypothetical protein